MKRTLFLFATLMLFASSIFATAGNQPIKYAKLVDANGRQVHFGDTVTVKGIVQSVNMPGTLTGSYFFSIYDSSSAITIYMARTRGGGRKGYNYTYTPTLGDSVSLTATVAFYTVRAGFGVVDTTGFEILAPLPVSGYDITLINSGNTVHNPTLVSGLREKEESNLVELDSLTLSNSSQWTAGTGNFVNVQAHKVSDTTKKFMLHVPSDVISSRVPLGIFNVQGIVYQQDITAPYTSNYMLIPRYYSDFNIISAPKIPIHKIIEINQETSGIADSTGKLVRVKGIVQSTNLYPPGVSKNVLLISIFDNTGSIIVYNSTSNMGYTPNIGDSFFVEGTVAQIKNVTAGFPPTQFNTGWTYISPDSIALPSFSTGNTIKNPIQVTTLADSLESKLITLKNVKLLDTTQWDTTGTSFGRFYFPKYQMYVDLVDQNNNHTRACILRIDSLFFIRRPIDYFNITGIEGQDTITPLAFSIYPRFNADIQMIPPVLSYYKISQVKGNDGNGVATAINTKCYLKGVAHSENLLSGGLKFSLVDNTGAITVYRTKALANYTPLRGDSLKVYGKISQINGLTVILADSIEKISSGNPLQNTYTVSVLIEADESYPRKLVHVKLVSQTQWNPAASTGTNGFSITVKDTTNSDTFSVFISNATSAFKMSIPQGPFNITGILQQSDMNSPFNSGYYLVPRDSNDIWLLSRGVQGIENQSNNQIPVTIYPNPATQLVNIQFGALNGAAVMMNLYSATGVLIHSEKVYGSSQMDISNLAKGMYFIKMNTEGGLQSSCKLIKE